MNVYEIVGSEMLELEMERMGDETKSGKLKSYIRLHICTIAYTDEIKKAIRGYNEDIKDPHNLTVCI